MKIMLNLRVSSIAIAIAVSLLAVLAGCSEGKGTTSSTIILESNAGECNQDIECKPSACCHPTECMPNANKLNCEGVACTMDCRPGTLDCGQGTCKCISNKCKAVING